MSIPPLVCCTPPPPEQCEDDKDHEDFDISYNLSQEDDEDCSDYNYGNYSSYNTYQSKSEERESMEKDSNLSGVLINRNVDEKKSCNHFNSDNFTPNSDLLKDSITKLEESGVEDLNLIVNNDILHSNHLIHKDDDTDKNVDDECPEKNTRIQDEGGTNIVNTEVSVLNNISMPNDNLEIKNEDILSTNQIDEISVENNLPDKTNETEENTFMNEVIKISVIENPEIYMNMAVNKIQEETPTDDEFGDFEDFQFTSSENCQVLSVSSENPWENNCNKEDEVCTFTANFDLNRPGSLEKIDDTISCERTQNIINNSIVVSDDDFGNFDEFSFSENKEIMPHTKAITSNPDVSVWNLQSQDNNIHVEDSINSVLTSIFAQEIPNSENELLGKLESFLSETWGHLIDIDIRQPYMINWNNSLGQKTLLKALSIDSRNILFGPKWSYNMPKYAANLNTAPLQPQKQLVSNNPITDPAEVSNRESGIWVDPFTTDRQEYTYAEALLLDLEHLMATLDQMAHKHSTLKISELLACHTENANMGPDTVKRPTEINVLESKSSTKCNTIYSSTINVQPLRHINLPDTHIFTPTDSETPRSKTIHYDSSPSAIVSQIVQDDKCQPENLSSQLSNVEKEYYDFQDFKGSNVGISSVSTVTHTTKQNDVNSTNEKTIPGSGLPCQTQILQPIKLEPIIPTLNWPDPGEVKETFDDFSDFISSNSWINDKGNKGVASLDSQQNRPNLQNSSEYESKTENVDDDFETFQSAPPSTSAMNQGLNSKVRSQMLLVENLSIKNVSTCDNSCVKIESKKQHDNVQVFIKNTSMSSNISNMQQDFTSPQTVSGIQNSNDMLQPISTSGLNRQQHKSDQILQPLSLESYSQINWPDPGIDLQDLSRFNPINSLHSLKSDTSASGNSKSASPAHNSISSGSNPTDDDIWGDFISSVPKQQQQTPKKAPTFADDDEWTDFVSSPSIKPQNGLNTISFNVHTNLSMQKSCQNKFGPKNNQISPDIPTLNYITPKSGNHGMYSEKHFQNL